MIFEDKNIIDNALNLWAGLLQSQPNLFDEFTKMLGIDDKYQLDEQFRSQ